MTARGAEVTRPRDLKRALKIAALGVAVVGAGSLGSMAGDSIQRSGQPGARVLHWIVFLALLADSTRLG